MRRTVATLLVALGALTAAGPAQASKASPTSAVFAHGVSPGGEHWSARASVGLRRQRHQWSFEIGFKFSGGFIWGGGSEIPIGRPIRMRRDADGYGAPLSGSEGTAFGYAGPEVTTIKMKMSDGSTMRLHPKFPPRRLRRKFVWMRGFRYFIEFYPGHAFVTEYWLYDKAGKQIGCNNYAEGELYDSVCGTAPVT